MARYRESVCRLCRREGMKLFLKGDRCFSNKCAIERRNFPPGQHGKRRAKILGYGIQLREKQKVKRYYGVLESQFRITFGKAERMKGVTGENLLSLLERRLDNVVHRLGFASSRSQARQLIRHGHVTLNGKNVNVPSVIVGQGAVITVKEKSRKNPLITAAIDAAKSRGVPAWLSLSGDQFEGKVVALPKREDVTVPVNEKLIVELYSK
ncbi:MAG: 30S ribosomal protein S4 [Acidobacteria bacterium]|nr:30S ribosomal protein S4 [Acidobacteriota bacterium]MCG3192495.1 30S ribosomal protein S4 [Thermoanaerobaculia bacterium]MCK6683328.1 30S ribosomal protein S4 [Thermoanaerobaculia bacterium]